MIIDRIDPDTPLIGISNLFTFAYPAVKVKWQTPNGIRASLTDPQMLAKMKASGCVHITVAPESGSVRVLKDIVVKGADFDLDQLKGCGAMAHELVDRKSVV